MKKIYYLLLMVLPLFTMTSCSDDDSETVTETGVTLNVVTASGEIKPNYIVMMFEEPVELGEPLPEILMQVTSNSEGVAVFELDDCITSEVAKTYYFEAFTENTNSYTWESVTHPSFELKKGRKVTSTIVVK